MVKVTIKTAKVVIKRGGADIELPAEFIKNGLQWNSQEGEWQDVASEPADPATGLIKVRVWSDTEIIDEVTDELVKLMTSRKFGMVERSLPYMCRPPKQLESRVYLAFVPPAKSR